MYLVIFDYSSVLMCMFGSILFGLITKPLPWILLFEDTYICAECIVPLYYEKKIDQQVLEDKIYERK
jgi:hypothetical protein